MANPTSNFLWQMPTATDLVTDLPADFAVFGQAVDTSMAGLKGGTTGQVLSKTSGTDMAFTWASDATGMTNPMTTTGDVIYSSSGSTPARLGIGTALQVLRTNAGATAPEWAAPAGGGKVLQVISATYATEVASTSGGAYYDTGLTATITPSAVSSKVLVMIQQAGIYKGAGNVNNALKLKAVRGSTNIGDFAINAGFTNTTMQLNMGGAGFVYLDSPATTSATTYKSQFGVYSGFDPVGKVQEAASMSTIVLMEIGA